MLGQIIGVYSQYVQNNPSMQQPGSSSIAVLENVQDFEPVTQVQIL